MSKSENPEYVLGHSERELERLIEQAAFFGDLTAHTLRLAGLQPGMRVLDLGCGAGDVSFLAAAIVGATGQVVGADQNADAIKLATGRADAAGLSSRVSFTIGDITQLPYRQEFDAVIGRLVILYLGDQAAGVRAFANYVKRDGIIYFQEFCAPGSSAIPAVPLYDECIGWINTAFERAKINLYTGMHLGRIYLDAGLPMPRMLGMARVEGGETSHVYTYITETVRSLIPLLERTGAASAADIGIDTLAGRLKEQSLARGAVLHAPELIAAWTRRPPAQ